MIKVLYLQTIRDGGILDPDDYIRDVVEDKELVFFHIFFLIKNIKFILFP